MTFALLILRLVVGLTMAAHGAQKLFGWFGGYGLKGTGGFLEQLGFIPGRRHALLVGLAEFGGGLLLALGLATPLVRSFVAIPAGIVRVPFRRFVPLAFAGSAVFCFGLGGAGWALGTAYTHAHRDLRYVDYAVVVGVLALAAYLALRWLKAARVSRRASDPAR